MGASEAILREIMSHYVFDPIVVNDKVVFCTQPQLNQSRERLYCTSLAKRTMIWYTVVMPSFSLSMCSTLGVF